MTPRSGILHRLARLFVKPAGDDRVPVASRAVVDVDTSAARTGRTATVEIAPPPRRALHIEYAPDRDGAPDGGEIVWTWVPYDEADGRGKDRPVLVIARQDADRVYAVRLTSKAHDGDRDYLAIGAGEWDARGRPSWVDVEQVYSVHRDGMRREASALPRDRFARVAAALHSRYGWSAGR
ncbi:type II toxin-antitoxin system PemK/MazF family toxin [Microbacterium yannicii]|uniref:type II toxin-antitoxin system PemK/MazF family toxin n=1 Tax=Microbacterium yannicii TaxID=671622 RepID=UPI0002E9D1D9|nr:type II toxin-antitoxin system PemK/MazF family toxin [Microbacterium yannicii]